MKPGGGRDFVKCMRDMVTWELIFSFNGNSRKKRWKMGKMIDMKGQGQTDAHPLRERGGKLCNHLQSPRHTDAPRLLATACPL